MDGQIFVCRRKVWRNIINGGELLAGSPSHCGGVIRGAFPKNASKGMKKVSRMDEVLGKWCATTRLRIVLLRKPFSVSYIDAPLCRKSARYNHHTRLDLNALRQIMDEALNGSRIATLAVFFIASCICPSDMVELTTL